jgi:hypothetical protein
MPASCDLTPAFLMQLQPQPTSNCHLEMICQQLRQCECPLGHAGKNR